MGDTGQPDEEPRLAPAHAARRRGLRGGGGRRGAVVDGTLSHDVVVPGLTDLYRAHYEPMVRLAALLTGDAAMAERVAREAFVALHGASRRPHTRADVLPALRRLVVASSRRALLYHRAETCATPPPGFARSSLVLALQTLTAQQREAVVLTCYLDLTEADAASAMLVSRAILRRDLAAATAALHAMLPVAG